MICSGVGLSSHGFPLSGFIQVKMQFNQIMSWDFSHYKLVNLLKLFGKQFWIVVVVVELVKNHPYFPKYGTSLNSRFYANRYFNWNTLQYSLFSCLRRLLEVITLHDTRLRISTKCLNLCFLHHYYLLSAYCKLLMTHNITHTTWLLLKFSFNLPFTRTTHTFP